MHTVKRGMLIASAAAHTCRNRRSARRRQGRGGGALRGDQRVLGLC
jgi:hypothetical protein